MDVGLVVYGDLENVSGGFLYDRELVDHLRERGDRVDVVSLPWRSYPRHLLDNVSRTVATRLRRSYDVLLQDELCHPSLLGLNRRRNRDCPVVSLVHSPKFAEARTTWRSRFYRGVERRYLTGVDGVVCNSRDTQALVGQLSDVPSVVAPPGRGHRRPAVTTDEIVERSRETPFRVAFVGNVIPRKGIHTLLDGLDRLPTEAWRLTVIGSVAADPSYAARIRRQIERLGLSDAVTLTGRLPDEALDSLLGAQHVLAMPSRYEAFGIAYLEGMGFGLPALATTAGGADEIVTDGENGFLVPPDDPQAIARRLRPVVDDRTRLRELSVRARETYEAHHSWAETARRIRTFLRRLAA